MSIHCRPFNARPPRRTDEWLAGRTDGPFARRATTPAATAPVERPRAGDERSLPSGVAG
ncbi:hypothetical protein HUG10_10865 [Halorarum halophilum]|uniref:Uncharacterized protein n=1 Tax=Halorarum halophilum TaxID=2743090 RepID=A0A7D5GLH8_9EURY|nr:hypothetical protein [Halobaculum halophilum]QLG28024.1 hypothetical protein HUG10_10865 [Halobaculum halophilum]